MTARFEGKVAIVTGAASGIGKAVMQRLASEGARVVAVDIDSDRLAVAVENVAGAMAMTCNLVNHRAIDGMVGEVIARLGRIDVLVNNAGIGNRERVKLHEQDPDDWDRVMAVNVRALFLLQRAIIPYMLVQGGGAIVNMASIGSFRATSLTSPYITSKGAVLMMTRAAALDYAQDNIRINAVCPGTTLTEMLEDLSPQMMDMLVARTPQGRLALPAEVAALTAFLASDEAPHMTGGAYGIDGGRSAG